VSGNGRHQHFLAFQETIHVMLSQDKHDVLSHQRAAQVVNYCLIMLSIVP